MRRRSPPRPKGRPKKRPLGVIRGKINHTHRPNRTSRNNPSQIFNNQNVVDNIPIGDLQISYRISTLFQNCVQHIPQDTFFSNVGSYSAYCIICQGIHFTKEIHRQNIYSLCCQSGKTNHLPLHNYPNEFKELITGRHVLSENFNQYIRNYNSAFSFVSVEAKHPPGFETNRRGPYFFKITGQIHHFTGTLYGDHPTGGVLYIIDTSLAVRNRIQHPYNENLRCELLAFIHGFLRENNPYAAIFQSVQEAVNSHYPGRNIDQFGLEFFNTPGDDIRRSNLPIVSEIAAIFDTTEGIPPSNRSFCIFPRGSQPTRLDYSHQSLDPMAYPIIFPLGETGWHYGMFHNTQNRTERRTKLTFREYVCYQLTEKRNHFNPKLHCGKLTQQLIVDYYCRYEGMKLAWVRNHQEDLRVDTYNGLRESIQNINEAQALRSGRIVILPSSITGTPRYYYKMYLDAMAIVRKFGKPDYFITMTCNPKWPEIISAIQSYDKVEHRPDIVVRVFSLKVTELLNLITKKNILGIIVSYVYTIEFQKRGLPHIHILIKVNDNDVPREPEDIDKIISAEIPDPRQDPLLHELVSSHMIHGPCGALNPSAICMTDRKCKKNFPKSYQNTTLNNENGFPFYKRPNNGRTIIKRINGENVNIDNSFVVPYNPFLIKYFRCHINVELCISVSGVKYIYKYITKGYDSANARIVRSNADESEYDEIDIYLNTRYIGPSEAVYRLFKLPMQGKSHTVIALPVHLPMQQSVYFREGQLAEVVNNERFAHTLLLDWFRVNSMTPCNLLYPEMPTYYTIEQNKKWRRRVNQRQTDAIGRMHSVPIVNTELYYLRTLLLYVKNATSYEELKTFEQITYRTFKETAIARGLLCEDSEWHRCLDELSSYASPQQMRETFSFILVFETPTNSLQLFETFKQKMSEDYLIDENRDCAVNQALRDIENILKQHRKTLQEYDLPAYRPDFLLRNIHHIIYDPNVCAEEAERLLSSANSDQRSLINEIVHNIEHHNDSICNAYFIDGPGGTGKTFVYKYLIDYCISKGLSVLPVAWTGIAAMLLKSGRTVHSRFQIPLNLEPDSVSNMQIQSNSADEIKNSNLIIWDEASMASANALICVDRLLKDITRKNNIAFGGKLIVLGGDFRQTLPVIPQGCRSSIVKNCLKSCDLWKYIHKRSFTINMRTENDQIEFANLLLSIGEGRYPTLPDTYNIFLPQDLVIDPDSCIIKEIYGDPINIEDPDFLSSRAILCPKNSHCVNINNKILDLINSEEKIYYSNNEIIEETSDSLLRFPPEYLDSLEFGSIPPHELRLKNGSIVILLRNLNVSGGLINGTRLKVEQMFNSSLKLQVITGEAKGRVVCFPRLDLSPTDITLPFKFKRRQYPIRSAFAMTINKSQGQTLEKVGLYLPEPCFTHGQLYVGMSRVKTRSSLRIYIPPLPTGGKSTITANVVYREVL